MITGTYDLQVNPDWNQIPLQNVYLECDCSEAPVTINLPKISTFGMANGVNITIADGTKTAHTNHIQVNCFQSEEEEDDYINSVGTTQIQLIEDGESVVFRIVAEQGWSAYKTIADPSGVQTVSSDGDGVVTVDNTDPANPIIGFNGVYTDNTTIEGIGTSELPLIAKPQLAWVTYTVTQTATDNPTITVNNSYNLQNITPSNISRKGIGAYSFDLNSEISPLIGDTILLLTTTTQLTTSTSSVLNTIQTEIENLNISINTFDNTNTLSDGILNQTLITFFYQVNYGA